MSYYAAAQRARQTTTLRLIGAERKLRALAHDGQLHGHDVHRFAAIRDVLTSRRVQLPAASEKPRRRLWGLRDERPAAGLRLVSGRTLLAGLGRAALVVAGVFLALVLVGQLARAGGDDKAPDPALTPSGSGLVVEECGSLSECADDTGLSDYSPDPGLYP